MVRHVKSSPIQGGRRDHHRPVPHEPRHRRDPRVPHDVRRHERRVASSSRRSSSRTAPSPRPTCTPRRRSASRSSPASSSSASASRRSSRSPATGCSSPPGRRTGSANVGDETAHFVCEVTPALGFEQLIETMFSLAEDGKVNKKGMPNPLRLAVIARHHFGDVRLPVPARVAPAPRPRASARPLGRLLGYTRDLRARRPEGARPRSASECAAAPAAPSSACSAGSSGRAACVSRPSSRLIRIDAKETVDMSILDTPYGIASLSESLGGSVVFPATLRGTRPAGLQPHHRPAPAAVAFPADVEDVRRSSVSQRAAASRSRRSGPATTRRRSATLDGVILLKTDRLDAVEIDPDAMRARVGAGVKWEQSFRGFRPRARGSPRLDPRRRRSSATASAAASAGTPASTACSPTASPRSSSSPPTAAPPCRPRPRARALLGAARRRRQLRRRHGDRVPALPDLGGLRREPCSSRGSARPRSSTPGASGRRPCPTR